MKIHFRGALFITSPIWLLSESSYAYMANVLEVAQSILMKMRRYGGACKKLLFLPTIMLAFYCVAPIPALMIVRASCGDDR